MFRVEVPRWPLVVVAVICTFPDLRVVIITPPTVASGTRSTMLGSDALQVTAIGSALVAIAGPLNLVPPANPQFHGRKKMKRSPPPLPLPEFFEEQPTAAAATIIPSHQERFMI